MTDQKSTPHAPKSHTFTIVVTGTVTEQHDLVSGRFKAEPAVVTLLNQFVQQLAEAGVTGITSTFEGGGKEAK